MLRKLVGSILLVNAHAALAQQDDGSFTVRDIRIEGLQRISEGTVYNYLPVNIGDQVDQRRVGEALRALRELEARQQAPEACAWTMARSALGEPALRASATSLLARWIGRDEGIGPPRGFLDLAVALERGGSSELASRTFAVARARQEPEARALSIQHAIRRAWSLHARGERREAYRLLRGAIEDASAGASPPRTA